MEGNSNVIYAKKCQDFELSGDLRVFAASGTPVVHINRCWDGTPAGRFAAEAYCLWSDTALYFGFRCPYEELVVDDSAPLERARWQLWDLDIAELLISSQPQPVDHYYEFEVAPSGHWMDLEVVFWSGRPFYNWDRRLNSGVRSQISGPSRGWTAELKILTSVLCTQEVHAGDEWSLNLFRTHGRADGRRYLALWPTFTPQPDFHAPSRFGRIRFAD